MPPAMVSRSESLTAITAALAPKARGSKLVTVAWAVCPTASVIVMCETPVPEGWKVPLAAPFIVKVPP